MKLWKGSFLVSVCVSMLFSGGVVFGEEQLNREEVVKAVTRLEQRQEDLQKEIDNLKKVVGMSVDVGLDIKPLAPSKEMSERLHIRLEDGIKDYEEGEYEQAKENFYLAWEKSPDSYITNVNLGLAYYKLGNVSLAKKMFKTALEKKKDFDGVEDIKKLLGLGSENDQDEDGALTHQEEEIDVAMQNLKKEAESYMKSPLLSYPEKMKDTITILNEMVDVSKGDEKAIRKYYLDMGEVYAAFGLYTNTLDLWSKYEKAMQGKVLPDGYHSRLLQVEEHKKEQDAIIDKYIGNQPKKDIKRKLDRDLKELSIFAVQLDEFVKQANDSDDDFVKLCQRLKEYRWGNRKDRHVFIMDRYQNILYTSLPGMLPIDRYQDNKGHQFLKDITFLADRLHLKETEFFEVELKINDELVPYDILYTYIPKHKAFIVVRIARQDLVS